MSAFASYASSINSPNTVLPPVHTTGTEGSTYKYESRGGKRKTSNARIAKTRKNKTKIVKHIKSKPKSKSNRRKH